MGGPHGPPGPHEVQAHMVLLDPLDRLVLPWARTTLAHTTRDLLDLSKYSVLFVFTHL